MLWANFVERTTNFIHFQFLIVKRKSNVSVASIGTLGTLCRSKKNTGTVTHTSFLAEEVHRPGRWSFWMAALLFSIIFAGGHLSNPDENKSGIIMVFIDGMNMCFTLWRTGNLWFAIGNHAAWDWGSHILVRHTQ